MPNKKLYHTHK